MTEDKAISENENVHWGLGDVAIGYLMSLALPLIVGLAIVAAGYSNDSEDVLPFPFYILGLVTTWAGFGAVPMWAAYKKGSGSLATDFGLKIKIGPDLWRGVLAGLSMQLLVIPLVYFPLQKLVPDLQEEAEKFSKNLILGFEGYQLVIVAITIVTLTPIVEELFFRGLFLRSVERRFGTTWAVIASSVVFALSHVNELLGIPALFLLALLLGWLTVRTGRLGSAIIAHAIFNGVTVAILVTTT